MTTYVQTPVELGKAGQVENPVVAGEGEVTREQLQAMARERRPRRGALVFVSGFMLGAVATTVASILGRGRRTPFVLGNRNVFVSLPFSGITMAAPSIRAKGTRRRPGRSGRFSRFSRGMARSAARGAASGMARGMVRGTRESREKKRAQ